MFKFLLIDKDKNSVVLRIETMRDWESFKYITGFDTRDVVKNTTYKDLDKTIRKFIRDINTKDKNS